MALIGFGVTADVHDDHPQVNADLGGGDADAPVMGRHRVQQVARHASYPIVDVPDLHGAFLQPGLGIDKDVPYH